MIGLGSQSRGRSRRGQPWIAVRAASCVVALALATRSAAQAQIIAGRVLAADSATPVRDARVRLLARDGVERAAVVTDSAGWFQVRLADAGPYSVAVEHIAFAAFRSDPLELGTNQTVSVEIRLGREAIPLAPLVVTARKVDRGRLAGFRERHARNAFGRFVTREEIERRAAFYVTDLFRTMPAVRVTPVNRNGNPSGMTTNLILMRGGGFGMCAPTIYLDDVRIDQSSSFPIDDLVNPDVLEGIEVYTSATAPAQYMTFQDCGVILLWTREGEPGRGHGWLRNIVGASLAAVLVVLVF